MPSRAPVPPAEPWHDARPELERAYRVDARGITGPTASQVAGRWWRPVGHGWYRPVGAAATVEQRIVEASYALPAGGGVTGWAALRWLGGRWFDGTEPDGSLLDVALAVPAANRAHRPGVRLSKERIGAGVVVHVDGLRLTAAAHSVVHQACAAPDLLSAVTVVDMACFNDLVSLDEVADEVLRNARRHGIGLARAALPLASENAWSPPEVAFRMAWVATGLGQVRCNVPVFHLDGRLLATVDLLDVALGVAGEYQGVHHFERGQRRRDIAREAELRAAGLEYVELIAGETERAFAARLRATYARAQRIPVAERRWVTQPPHWWKPTETVAQRRALSDRDRERLLAHRAA